MPCLRNVSAQPMLARNRSRLELELVRPDPGPILLRGVYFPQWSRRTPRINLPSIIPNIDPHQLIVNGTAQPTCLPYSRSAVQTPEMNILQAVDPHQCGNAHSGSQSVTTSNSTKPERKAWAVVLRWSRRDVGPTSGHWFVHRPDHARTLRSRVSCLPHHRCLADISNCTTSTIPSNMHVYMSTALRPHARESHCVTRFCRFGHPEVEGRGYFNSANSCQHCHPLGR